MEGSFRMPNFQTLAAHMGTGFTDALNRAVDDQFPPALAYLADAFDVRPEVYADTEDGRSLRLFLKRIWELAFPAGAAFALGWTPDE